MHAVTKIDRNECESLIQQCRSLQGCRHDFESEGLKYNEMCAFTKLNSITA